MDWLELVARRRMCRDYDGAPVADDVLRRVLDQARRVPSAGFSQGIDFVVLEGAQTATFWDHTLPAPERAGFRWPGLLRAPVVVLPMADSGRYLDRYSQPDKARAGLGASADSWPVPYWYIDTGMAAMALLYAVVNEGLGALFFGVFRNESALLTELGVPDGIRPIGAIALGHPAPSLPATPSDRTGPAVREGSPALRPRRSLDETVHRGGW